MNTVSQSKKERKYFIDWLRIALIISVFFFHIVTAFANLRGIKKH